MKDNNKVVHVVYSSDAIKKGKILVYNTDVVVGDKKDLPTRSLKQTQIATLLLSTPTVNVMTCYDSEFASLFSNPTAEIQNMMSTVASAFSPGNMNLNIKAYRYYTNIANGNAQTVLNNFVTAAANDRDSTNSDLAILFTGKEITDDNIGIANSYNGNSGQAYSVAQMVSAGLLASYQATSSQRKSVTAHEFGHNFGAAHNEGYDYYVLGSHYYTAMWTPFQAGSAMKTEFSNLNNHGDSSHNNILHILTNKNTIAGFQ